MNDKKLSLSISVASALAWATWAGMAVLLGVAVETEDLMWAAFALALAAIAATLHVRCFMIQLDCRLHGAYELGREAERVTQLRSNR